MSLADELRGQVEQVGVACLNQRGGCVATLQNDVHLVVTAQLSGLMTEETLTSKPAATLRALPPYTKTAVAQVCRSTHAPLLKPNIRVRPMPELMNLTAALPGARDSNRAKKVRVKGAELTETVDGEHMQTRSAQPSQHPALAMKAACYVGRRPG